jgi:hypothetical protein
MRSVADGRSEPRAFSRRLVLDGREGMRPQPQHAGGVDRIHPSIPPPYGLIAAAVDFAVVSSTQRDRELIADLPAKRAALGKSQVMSVRRESAANQAWVLGDRAYMVSVASPACLRQSQRGFVDSLRPRASLSLTLGRTISAAPRRYGSRSSRLGGAYSAGCQGRQPRLERLLHAQGIRRRQFILLAQGPVRPDCRVIAAAKVFEFGLNMSAWFGFFPRM